VLRGLGSKTAARDRANPLHAVPHFFPVIPIWAGILLASLIFIPVMIPGIFLGAWIRFRAMARGQHVSRAQGG
jgi:hypothetical protein